MCWGNSPYLSHSPRPAAFLGIHISTPLPALLGTALHLVLGQVVLVDAPGFSLGASVLGQTETPSPA